MEIAGGNTIDYKENWSTGEAEQDDKRNSRDQARILEDMEKAIQDLAELISKNTQQEMPETEISAQQVPDQQMPAVSILQGQTAEGYEIEAAVISLIADIESVTTLNELEALHSKFSAKALELKARISEKKTREVIEAFLTLTAALKMVDAQVAQMRAQNITKVNGSQLSAQITSRLATNQQAIRLAAERTIQNAQRINNQNLMKQLQNLQVALESSLKSQRNLNANSVVSMEQQMMKALLAQIKSAQEAIQKNNLPLQQMIQNVQKLQSNMRSLQLQIQQRITQLQAQMKTATTAVQGVLEQQIRMAQQLVAQLSESRALLNIQNALLSRAADAERSRNATTEMQSQLGQKLQVNFAQSVNQAQDQARIAAEFAARNAAQRQQQTASEKMSALDAGRLAATRAEEAGRMARTQMQTQPIIQADIANKASIAATEAARAADAARKPLENPVEKNPVVQERQQPTTEIKLPDELQPKPEVIKPEDRDRGQPKDPREHPKPGPEKDPIDGLPGPDRFPKRPPELDPTLEPKIKTKEKPTGEISPDTCNRKCPCGGCSKGKESVEIAVKTLDAGQKAELSNAGRNALGGKDAKSMSGEEQADLLRKANPVNGRPSNSPSAGEIRAVVDKIDLSKGSI